MIDVPQLFTEHPSRISEIQDASLKYATVDGIQCFTEQFLQIPGFQTALTSTSLGAWPRLDQGVGTSTLRFHQLVCSSFFPPLLSA